MIIKNCRKILQSQYFALPHRLAFCSKKPFLNKQQIKQLHEQQISKSLNNELEDEFSYDKQKPTNVRMIGAGLFALLFGGILSFLYSYDKNKNKQLVPSETQNSEALKIEGDWELINTKGKILSNHVLKGTNYLIYFGFTRCPDVCPTFLINLSNALRKLRTTPEYKYTNLEVIFVSVDPERDTPQILQKYLKNFDSSIHGAGARTNSDMNLKNCMKVFKVYANKIDTSVYDSKIEKMVPSYTIDHTTLSYLMSDQGKLIKIIPTFLNAQTLYNELSTLLAGYENKKMKLAVES